MIEGCGSAHERSRTFMEQLAQLTIICTDTQYRFRLNLPDGPGSAAKEYITELTSDIHERLRRALQTATQQMQTAELKPQTRRGAINDSLLSLGRFLFETLMPSPLQEALHRLDAPLLLNTNTPDIPWELLYDSKPSPGHFLCQYINVGRQMNSSRSAPQRLSQLDRINTDVSLHKTRKIGRREAQGLSVLFLVNPTSTRPVAEEEVASLCTTLPESVCRIILYRQQANQLEMRMRISADFPQVVHYAGPLASFPAPGEPVLALAGSSRLDTNAASQLFSSFLKRPLVFLSFYDGSQVATLASDEMETLASNLMAAGAGAVPGLRWPVNTQHAREFIVQFYQEVADGVSPGEALRRTRSTAAQRHPDDLTWSSYVLYGDPTAALVTSTPGRDRSLEPSLDSLND